MTGSKGGERFRYVDSTRYNKYGQRSAIYYGNGTHTNYTYDNLQRLAYLVSVDGQGNVMQNLRYSYDAVSNITQVDNNAPAIGTLGGPYANKYKYDNLYRLTSASQNYGAGNRLVMAYSPSGRVLSKWQTAKGQGLEYAYCPESQPHAIRRICNRNDNTLHDLRWDLNGNLAQVHTYHELERYKSSRFLSWTEDNRLAAVADPCHFSYYGYDCSGERTLKLTGKSTLLDINADVMVVAASLDRVTLYTSPYMVATEHGYTMHIYAGEERVCAKKGAGGFNSMCLMEKRDPALSGRAAALYEEVRAGIGIGTLTDGCEGKEDNLLSLELEEPAAAVDAHTVPDPSRFAYTMSTLATAPRQGPIAVVTETDLYFYHPDHLGSASWITDANGTAIQHIQYCPYGEPFVDQHPANIYQERYTFTGKERDAETGYHYFGARYLDADWMTGWLSVAPLSDKYPNISPYNYCVWNPVRISDPDGLSPISVLAKYASKSGIKIATKKYIKNNIQRRLEKYMTKDMLKQFAKDADDIIGMLNDSWWEIGLELIPIAGDIYGASKYGKKIAMVYREMQKLENKYVDKIYKTLSKSDRAKFKKAMRNRGVSDARKDQDAGVIIGEHNTKHGPGVEGHHKDPVSENISKSSDPSNIEFLERSKHQEVHKNKQTNGQ